MEFLVRQLNYIANEFDWLYSMNSGGCCFFAYRIAYWLEKYGIDYYFIIQDEKLIVDNIGKHYCLQLLPHQLYINKSEKYTHVKRLKRTSNQILDYYNNSKRNQMKTLTVGELIERLKKMPKTANVFMLTDRTESNWDEDNATFRHVHGIEYVEKETVYPDDGFTDSVELNVLLEIEEDEI